jgi:hypothetical protein
MSREIQPTFDTKATKLFEQIHSDLKTNSLSLNTAVNTLQLGWKLFNKRYYDLNQVEGIRKNTINTTPIANTQNTNELADFIVTVDETALNLPVAPKFGHRKVEDPTSLRRSARDIKRRKISRDELDILKATYRENRKNSLKAKQDSKAALHAVSEKRDDVIPTPAANDTTVPNVPIQIDSKRPSLIRHFATENGLNGSATQEAEAPKPAEIPVLHGKDLVGRGRGRWFNFAAASVLVAGLVGGFAWASSGTPEASAQDAPSPTTVPTKTFTPTMTPTPTVTWTPTATRTPVETATPTVTSTVEPSRTPTTTPTIEPSPTAASAKDLRAQSGEQSFLGGLGKRVFEIFKGKTEQQIFNLGDPEFFISFNATEIKTERKYFDELKKNEWAQQALREMGMNKPEELESRQPYMRINTAEGLKKMLVEDGKMTQEEADRFFSTNKLWRMAARNPGASSPLDKNVNKYGNGITYGFVRLSKTEPTNFRMPDGTIKTINISELENNEFTFLEDSNGKRYLQFGDCWNPMEETVIPATPVPTIRTQQYATPIPRKPVQQYCPEGQVTLKPGSLEAPIQMPTVATAPVCATPTAPAEVTWTVTPTRTPAPGQPSGGGETPQQPTAVPTQPKGAVPTITPPGEVPTPSPVPTQPKGAVPTLVPPTEVPLPTAVPTQPKGAVPTLVPPTAAPAQPTAMPVQPQGAVPEKPKPKEPSAPAPVAPSNQPAPAKPEAIAVSGPNGAEARAQAGQAVASASAKPEGATSSANTPGTSANAVSGQNTGTSVTAGSVTINVPAPAAGAPSTSGTVQQTGPAAPAFVPANGGPAVPPPAPAISTSGNTVAPR